MKIFISSVMNGKTEDQIIMEREEIINLLSTAEDEEVEIIDSVLKAENKPSLWYLGESIKLMADADLVVFAPGWEKGRGCIIEHECASKYGIPILELPYI